MALMTWTDWVRELRRLAKDKGAEPLLSEFASDHMDAWYEGKTPLQVLQDLAHAEERE